LGWPLSMDSGVVSQLKGFSHQTGGLKNGVYFNNKAMAESATSSVP
jgi:hypothetical protein